MDNSDNEIQENCGPDNKCSIQMIENEENIEETDIKYQVEYPDEEIKERSSTAIIRIKTEPEEYDEYSSKYLNDLQSENLSSFNTEGVVEPLDLRRQDIAAMVHATPTSLGKQEEGSNSGMSHFDFMLPEMAALAADKTAQEKNKKEIICHLCNKQFTKNWNLKKHLEVHEKHEKKRLERLEHNASNNVTVLDDILTSNSTGSLINNVTVLSDMSKHDKSDAIESYSSLDSHGSDSNNSAQFEFMMPEMVAMETDEITPKQRKKTAICPICEKTFNKNWNLKKHIMSVHEKHRPFACEHCSYKCTQITTLRQHTASVHDKIRNYSCEICFHAFALKHQLIAHVSSVHEKSRTFKCPLCDYHGFQACDVRKHVTVVHEKVKKFSCDYCEYRAACKMTLKTHILRKHEKTLSFACTKCDEKFFKARELKKHIKVHKEPESIERPFKCQLCGLQLKNAIDTEEHILAIHKGTEKDQISCNSCEYTCVSEDNLRKHKKFLHKMNLPFICDNCDSGFTQEIELNQHSSKAHEKDNEFRCDFCTFETYSKTSFKAHVMSVHEKRTPHFCNQCDYITPFKNHLTSHVSAVHQKIKGFNCDFCEYACARKEQMTHHVRTIHENKRYDCRVCGHKSTYPKDLKRHILRMHPEHVIKCGFCDFLCAQIEELQSHIAANHVSNLTMISSCINGTNNEHKKDNMDEVKDEDNFDKNAETNKSPDVE